MGTCGYICPSCEGKGFDDKGEPCKWCSIEEKDFADKPGTNREQKKEDNSIKEMDDVGQ